MAWGPWGPWWWWWYLGATLWAGKVNDLADKDTKALEKEKVKASARFAEGFLAAFARRKKRKRKPTDPAAPGGLDISEKLYE